MKPTAWKLSAAAAAVVVLVAMGIVRGQLQVRVRAVAKAPATQPAKKPAGPFEVFAKKQKVPCARVKVVKKLPKIDGVLDGVYKKQAAKLTFKFLAGGAAKPTATTTAYVLSTKTELVVFLDCKSPDMDALLAEKRERDDSVWEDDSIEIFLDPTNKRAEDGYMHVIVNSLATTYEAKGGSGAADTSWNPKLKVKTKVGKKGWTVEIAIPFKDLVKDPKKLNRVWAVNFNRMAYLIEGNEDTAWSPTEAQSSHVPSKFGCLWLDAGKIDNTKKK